MKPLIVNSRVAIPADELRFSFARSSGPGGQNVNKVNTKATLRWTPADSRAFDEPLRERVVARLARRLGARGELIITSQRFRDQARNKADCLEKLRQAIAQALRTPRRRVATRRPTSANRRRLDDKAHHSAKKASRRRPDE
jgi:ribosome-associated protein